MIATFFNVFTVLLGSVLGVLFGGLVSKESQDLVQVSAGIITLVIGLQMAFKTQRVISVLIALVLGGLLGSLLQIQGGIYALGEILKTFSPTSQGLGTFAQGFLTASLLFCVGAMTIIGCFEAGAEGKLDLILLKSVLDGFMAFVFAASLGIGVGFSALTILVYQGALTLASRKVKPLVDKSPLMTSEINGVGGALVIMIGLGLLNIKALPVGNFIPGLFFVVLLVLLDPWIQKLAEKLGFHGTRSS